MQFTAFANSLQALEGTTSRLSMTSLLAELFRQLTPTEVEKASYLLQGQLVPAYEGGEFQLSVKMVIRALARLHSTGGDITAVEPTNLFGEKDQSHAETEITRRYKQMGDLGTVAAEVIATLPRSSITQPLTILNVYEQLLQISQTNGEGSQEKKLELLLTLLTQADPQSAKFIVRIILGRLRLGFSTMTLIDALSWTTNESKQDRILLEEAYQKKADIGKLARSYLSGKTEADRHQHLRDYTVEVGVPVVPALCQRLNSAQEIIDKMGEVYAEPKYDGLRVQIHVDKKLHLLRTFTRNLEETSHMFPELQAAIHDLDCTSCILDGEAIGFDKKTGQLLPFQETITRKRKHDIESTAQSVPVRFYIFDVLAIDGVSLIDKPLSERKDRLKKLFKPTDVLYQAPYIQTQDAGELHQFHNQALQDKLEGAVIKQVHSAYQSGRKGWSWVKIKEEEGTRGKLSDTLDCVVMGYYYGRGKRTAFGIGAFLVGVLDDQEQLKTIAKIGTGLSDDQFRELKQRVADLEVKDAPNNYQVDKSLIPDVWVVPSLVVEIAADEITKSPNHTASLALRFPRLVKFRDDKTWSQATTLKEVASIL